MRIGVIGRFQEHAGAGVTYLPTGVLGKAANGPLQAFPVCALNTGASDASPPESSPSRTPPPRRPRAPTPTAHTAAAAASPATAVRSSPDPDSRRTPRTAKTPRPAQKSPRAR